MSMLDPIADMLTRLRNATAAGLPQVTLPGSNEKIAIANVFKAEGYVSDVVVTEDGPKKTMTITLKNYNGKPVIEGIERVSKPSRRIHCGSKDIPRVRNGQGTVVISTSKGILSGEKAAELNVGGEIICYIW